MASALKKNKIWNWYIRYVYNKYICVWLTSTITYHPLPRLLRPLTHVLGSRGLPGGKLEPRKVSRRAAWRSVRRFWRLWNKDISPQNYGLTATKAWRYPKTQLYQSSAVKGKEGQSAPKAERPPCGQQMVRGRARPLVTQASMGSLTTLLPLARPPAFLSSNSAHAPALGPVCLSNWSL